MSDLAITQDGCEWCRQDGCSPGTMADCPCPHHTPAITAEDGEARLAAALAPFGWTCTPDFWQRYYSDAWVFNLANAVERLNEEVERLRRQEREARRAVGWVVAACGGRVTVPEVVMVNDYDLMAYDEPLDGRTFVATLADEGPSLARKHQEHYRSCNCLGDSAECCVPSCECHTLKDEGDE